MRVQVSDAPKLIAERQTEATLQFIQHAIEQELQRRIITAGEIEGIGEKQVYLLRQHGITTAADIHRRCVERINGIGDKMTRNLLSWREQQEQHARHNVPPVPDNINQNAAAQARAELQTLMHHLQHGPQRLQAAQHSGTLDHQHTQAKLNDLLRQRAELQEQL